MRVLEISTESINRIAELNRNLRELSAAAVGDRTFLFLSEIEPTPEYLERRREIAAAIMELPMIQMQELEAVMWLGRGDFVSFEDALNYSKSFGEDPKGLANYLIAKPLFEYLPDGVNLLRDQDIALAN